MTEARRAHARPTELWNYASTWSKLILHLEGRRTHFPASSDVYKLRRANIMSFMSGYSMPGDWRKSRGKILVLSRVLFMKNPREDATSKSHLDNVERNSTDPRTGL